MSIFSFRSVREHIARRRAASLDSVNKIPLTERNVESFNNDGYYKDTVDEFDSESISEDARLKVQRSREVQISEWLRLLPRVGSYSSLDSELDIDCCLTGPKRLRELCR